MFTSVGPYKIVRPPIATVYMAKVKVIQVVPTYDNQIEHMRQFDCCPGGEGHEFPAPCLPKQTFGFSRNTGRLLLFQAPPLVSFEILQNKNYNLDPRALEFDKMRDDFDRPSGIVDSIRIFTFQYHVFYSTVRKPFSG